jgi:hypothetical protein
MTSVRASIVELAECDAFHCASAFLIITASINLLWSLTYNSIKKPARNCATSHERVKSGNPENSLLVVSVAPDEETNLPTTLLSVKIHDTQHQ